MDRIWKWKPNLDLRFDGVPTNLWISQFGGEGRRIRVQLHICSLGWGFQ